MPSIVIPAHNEERTLGRLLDRLLDGADDGEFDILVVCNGCTDDTAAVAAARGPRIRVVETPVPSKHEALRLGDRHAEGFPRLYVDADVELGAADVRALGAALDGPGAVLAAAPARELPMTGCSWRVRAYYRVWQRLPAVRDGLFGRGVIAMSAEGHARIAALPPLMADDLAASLAFTPAERAVVPTARVVVRPPRTWRDLIRRRIRAATSTAQLEAHQGTSATAGTPQPSARTGVADLRALLRADPALLPAVIVFLSAALAARRGARKAVAAGDFDTWLRDESSRQ
ncbi:glycosyltransferase family 2 protein [Streptomyces roseicoloratus]|uniref:4,4'-diaponeurosporenoate glycosyltransferase n=1 Tax=Streptomyces roseicoloratus TaxID=2508722 RepID=A0ABY9S1A8_9ACTN|nr:glycosyltransferase family 2 protein [Streptomyces roseicoloratus]WMX48217.1 glycosyltransferase family 2 protein [Streptomyces roseicoloratus]